MANFHERAATSMSPLMEQEQEGEDMDGYGNASSSNGCDCFGLFCFKTGWRRSNEHKHLLQQEEREYRETWLNEKLKRVKEVSEICAGPKWKNLIRKVGRYFSCGRTTRHHKFQYDPQSYALNFDGGFDKDGDDGGGFAS